MKRSGARVAGPVVLGSMDCSPTLFRRGQAQRDSSDQFFFNPMTAGWQFVITIAHMARMSSNYLALEIHSHKFLMKVM